MLKRFGSVQGGELVTEHHTSAAKLVGAGLAAYLPEQTEAKAFEQPPVDKMVHAAPVEKADAAPGPDLNRDAQPLAPPAKPGFFSKRKPKG